MQLSKIRNFLVFGVTAGALTACSQHQNAPDVDTKAALISQATEQFKDYSMAQQEAFEDCGVDEAEYWRLMALPHKEFDQDLKDGWRALSYIDECRAASSDLLKSYMAIAQTSYQQDTSTLIWHTGQVLAGSGNYADALRYFRQTYKDPNEYKDWNLYVDGTIAFIQHDKDALIDARDALSKIPIPEELKEARRKFLKDNPGVTMPGNFVDEPGNLSVLDKFIRCFEQTYSEAYGHCEG